MLNQICKSKDSKSYQTIIKKRGNILFEKKMIIPVVKSKADKLKKIVWDEYWDKASILLTNAFRKDYSAENQKRIISELCSTMIYIVLHLVEPLLCRIYVIMRNTQRILIRQLMKKCHIYQEALYIDYDAFYCMKGILI